jgi:predicted MFS family arabinose efflux permease
MVAWVAQGIAFAAMSLWATPVPVAVCAAAAGLVTVVGIRAMTQVLLVETTGPVRRSALAGQSILVDVTVSVGMLGGGVLIDRVGPQPMLLAAGLVTSAAAVVAGTARPRRWLPSTVRWARLGWGA